MITEVRLRNFKSFGKLQTAPLEAITVLVGANNSGKSNFLSFVDVLREPGWVTDTDFHRPPDGDGQLEIAWDARVPGPPTGEILATWQLAASSPTDWTETAMLDGQQWLSCAGRGGRIGASYGGTSTSGTERFALRYLELEPPATHARAAQVEQLVRPVQAARMVHLSIEALRSDSHPKPGIDLASDGSNLAAFVAGWRMEFPERMKQFDDIIGRCLPEMSQVLAQPTNGGMFRLLFKQRDGERFDAKQVSDGVLVFAGLVAHVLSAPQGALVLIEEPERGIHPRRLADFVELLRTLVRERQTQFIMATHSPALLNLFRDEPEAILMLRRETEGTTIHRLSDAHALTETLKRADPGEMLANGVFNEAMSA